MRRRFILAVFIALGGTKLAEGEFLNAPLLVMRHQALWEYEFEIPHQLLKVKELPDPLEQLNENLANCAALEASSNYWMERGEPEKATKALRAMVMLLRVTSGKYGELATAELNAGHTLAGLRPSNPNRKTLLNGPATPAQLLGIALGLQDGTQYWNEIVRATTNHAPVSEPAENIYTDCVDMGKGMKSCTTHR